MPRPCALRALGGTFVSALGGVLCLQGCSSSSSAADGGVSDAGATVDQIAPDAANGEGGATADTGGPPRQCPAATQEAGAPVTLPTPVCTPIMPASPVIATFAGASPTAFADWGTAPLVGGTYVFPACTTVPPEPASPLFGDYSASAWTISGTVGDFSGFGIWWDLQNGTMNGYPTYAGGLIDASAYAGIRFDISGTAGPLGVVTFSPLSANQQSPSTDPSRPTCGTCNPDAGPCNTPSTYPVTDLASTAKTVEVRWADLASGTQPFDPAKLSVILWYFPWTRGATPYPVDVTIANVQFIVAAAGDGGAD